MTVTRTTHHTAARTGRTAHAHHGHTAHPAARKTTHQATGDAFTPAATTARSATTLSGVIDRLDPAHNRKYLPHSGNTYCNVFAQDVTRALGAPLPQLNANDTERWLNGSGGAHGWRQVTADQAQAMANGGHPSIAIWRNTRGPHGHVGIIRPGQVTDRGPAMAQAGGHNFNNGHVRDGFGSRAVEFWVHD